MLAPGHYLNQSYLAVNRTLINSLTPEQNGRHFAGGISNAIFVNTNLCTSTNILSKYIPHGIIGKKSALDELMARCITGDKSNLLFIEPSLTLWHLSKMAEILHTAFHMHFHGWKLAHFNQHFIRIHSLGYIWQKVSIVWVKGLVPNRRQDITWTNNNQDIWGHCSLMAPVASDILVNTDSSTGMTPCWCQAITSTSPILLLIKLSSTLWHQSKRADILLTAFQMHFHE